MTLSLPYATAERVGGVVIALLDRACVGSRNGTHIVLKAEFTRCKFEKKQGTPEHRVGTPLSDDEDLVGSGYGSEDEYYPSALPSPAGPQWGAGSQLHPDPVHRCIPNTPDRLHTRSGCPLAYIRRSAHPPVCPGSLGKCARSLPVLQQTSSPKGVREAAGLVPLQTLTLGPLTSATTTKSALFGGITHTTSSSQGLHHTLSTTRAAAAGVAEAEEEEKTQIVVLRGLSTEMVVGIALASFIIGVCLTATLWVIHMKTDPRRQKRTDSSSAPRNSGYDLSAHSGSSTPSSQAPMTA
ncbi:hypothetical protein O3P69_012733 [Scylla paramamosain]|uniref:Uncharacterized protein n=1 Tax=Scylla paramamosain TaxID=85552 RepID=A0AAW0SGH1_SCYPA